MSSHHGTWRVWLRTVILVAGLLGALSLAACSFNVSTANVKNVVLARGADANLNPVDQTSTFRPEDPEIHALATLANAPSDTKVKAVWLAVDALPGQPNFEIDATELTTGSGTLHFFLTNRSKSWPTGRYRIDVYLNDKEQPAVSQEFTVATAQAPQAALAQPQDSTPVPAIPTPVPAAATREPSPVSTATKAPSSTPARSVGTFETIVFAQKVSQSGDPVAITDRFGPGTVQVHAFADFSGMAVGDEVLEEWSYEGENVADNTERLSVAEGNLHATLDSEKALPAGTYQLVLSVNGKVLQRGEFSVIPATPVPGARRERYRNESLGFALSYPRGWDVEEESDKVTFSDPDETLALIVATTDLDLAVDARTFGGLFVGGLSNEFADFEKGDESDITVAGEPAWGSSFTFQVDGVSAHGRLATITLDDRAYALMLLAHATGVGAIDDHLQAFLADFDLLSVGEATPAPVPATRSPEAVRTSPAGGTTRFEDDFGSQEASEELGWEFSTGDNVDYTWEPGRFTISVKRDNWLGVRWPDGLYEDFVAEAEGQAVSSDYAEYGIAWRIGGTAEARSYYLFGITSDGYYYLQKKLDGKWVEEDPVPATTSDLIETDGSNNLAVRAQGSKISLFINGTEVESLTDDSLSEGNVGLFAGTGENGSVTVRFSRLAIREP